MFDLEDYCLNSSVTTEFASFNDNSFRLLDFENDDDDDGNFVEQDADMMMQTLLNNQSSTSLSNDQEDLLLPHQHEEASLRSSSLFDDAIAVVDDDQPLLPILQEQDATLQHHCLYLEKQVVAGTQKLDECMRRTNYTRSLIRKYVKTSLPSTSSSNSLRYPKTPAVVLPEQTESRYVSSSPSSQVGADDVSPVSAAKKSMSIRSKKMIMNGVVVKRKISTKFTKKKHIQRKLENTANFECSGVVLKKHHHHRLSPSTKPVAVPSSSSSTTKETAQQMNVQSSSSTSSSLPARSISDFLRRKSLHHTGNSINYKVVVQPPKTSRAVVQAALQCAIGICV